MTDRSNIAIPVSYFLVGFGPSFAGTPLSVYMVKTLNASPAQQNTIGILMTLPWCFKVAYGFMSDGYPIFGQRRKPYFIIGYIINISSTACLAWLKTPSLGQLSTLIFTSTVGQIMADVMTDTMVVERAKLESEEFRGTFQAMCYSVRFFGGIIGSTIGACIYNKQQWGWGASFQMIQIVNIIVPLVFLLPTVPSLYDARGTASVSVQQQMNSIWKTVCKNSVWRPMSFIYLYNVLQWGNVSWSSYLQLSLGFKPFELGTLSMAANVMTLAGVLVYKRFFFKTSLRKIYLFTTIVPMIFSVLQLLLIFQINVRFGISDFAFSMGDNVITQLVASILFLPVCIMFASLCPDGCEGCIYAILTSYANVANIVASTFSNMSSQIWDVSNKTLKAHHYTGLWKLTVFTSLICCIPLLFLPCLLPTQLQQRELAKKNESNVYGGAVFILVLVISIGWAVFQSVMVIMNS
jgi:hypothetical protein